MSKLGQGYVQIYTGNGKGKTTAAIGQAVRAAGFGLKTYIVQFMKEFPYNEVKSLNRLKEWITIEQFGGDDFVYKKEPPGKNEIDKARRGLAKAKAKMLGGKYDIIILDEVCVSIYFGLFSDEEILSILDIDSSSEAAEGRRKYQNKFYSPLDKLLVETKEKGASDLFLSCDSPPLMKYHGDMLLVHKEMLSGEIIEKWVYQILSEEREKLFRKTNDMDLSYETPGGDRFRVNLYRHRHGVAAVFRVIPDKVPTLQELGFPDSLRKLCHMHQGIILVTGPASCGKTTTLAALIDESNKGRLDHIVTIEDPIEYIHENKGCLVNQREVGPHTDSFANALRASLREDPDIILVGELRDLETITMAITAAETGHLVFGTLHTTSAPKTVDRIIDAYPPSQQSQIRTMLSESLKAVISQQLCRTRDGNMIAAMEILLHTASLSKMIRDAKTFQIPSVMLTGQSMGMQTMDQALLVLVKNDTISGEEAYRRSFDKREFEHYVLGTQGAALDEATEDKLNA